MILITLVIEILLLIIFYTTRKKITKIEAIKTYNRLIGYTWGMVVANTTRLLASGYLSEQADLILALVASILSIVMLVELTRSLFKLQ